jgi:L-alanine-DL-glutamate epimerase-like enolase superfamily enzyme
VGLGETFWGAQTVEAHIHEYVAPRLLGRDPLAIDRIAKDLVGYLGFRSTGAEVRGNSAIDIALWDLFGKFVGQPIAQLLGGFSRPSIRTYNTCAGSEYISRPNGTVNSWSAPTADKYDDLTGFLTRADEIALELLADGITAMKIWPFDQFAAQTDGHYIAKADLKKALIPFEKIRKAVGDKMDIMVEFHSQWQLLPAIQIARALAPFETFWHEDPIRMDSLASLVRYEKASTAPICASETLGFVVRRDFRGAQNRCHGRGMAPSGRASRLHGTRGALRFDASGSKCAERTGSGKCEGFLPNLVRGSRHCVAQGRQRAHHGTAGAGPGSGARARFRAEISCSPSRQ